MVDGEKLVLFLRIVPDTGIDNHLFFIGNLTRIGNTDLFGVVIGKIFLREG